MLSCSLAESSQLPQIRSRFPVPRTLTFSISPAHAHMPPSFFFFYGDQTATPECPFQRERHHGHRRARTRAHSEARVSPPGCAYVRILSYLHSNKSNSKLCARNEILRGVRKALKERKGGSMLDENSSSRPHGATPGPLCARRRVFPPLSCSFRTPDGPRSALHRGAGTRNRRRRDAKTHSTSALCIDCPRRRTIHPHPLFVEDLGTDRSRVRVGRGSGEQRE